MLFLCLLTIAGCNKITAGVNGNSGTVSGSGEAPPQPIPFERLEDAISFLKSGELNEYNAYMDGMLSYFNETYQHMIELFMNDGFILNAEVSSEDFVVDELFLMPEQRYEDAGIIWNVTFKNQGYQIAVYHVKTECQEEGDDLNQYRARRFGSMTLESMQNGDAVIYYQSPSDGGRGRITQYIDETHYYVIRSTTSTEDKIALLNAIHFEKAEIK